MGVLAEFVFQVQQVFLVLLTADFKYNANLPNEVGLLRSIEAFCWLGFLLEGLESLKRLIFITLGFLQLRI